MGSGVCKGLSVAVKAATAEELEATLAGLPASSKLKLQEQLSSPDLQVYGSLRCKCGEQLQRQPVPKGSKWDQGWTCDWMDHQESENKYSSDEWCYGCPKLDECEWCICSSCWEQFPEYQDKDAEDKKIVEECKEALANAQVNFKCPECSVPIGPQDVPSTWTSWSCDFAGHGCTLPQSFSLTDRIYGCSTMDGCGWCMCDICWKAHEAGCRKAPQDKLDDALERRRKRQNYHIMHIESSFPDKPKAEESLSDRAQRVLSSGAVKLVRCEWVVECPSDWILKRMQDLPKVAFHGSGEAANMYMEDDLLWVVSYGWLSKGHPDPTGWHMQILRKFCVLWELHIDWSAGRFSVEDCGLFWDFLSLPQVDAAGTRTPREQIVFVSGLSIINLLYGSSKSMVLKQTRMPESFPDTGDIKLCGITWNPTPYRVRGWCIFEQTVSGIVKPLDKTWDLSKIHDDLINDTVFEDLEEVQQRCVAHRVPPLSPAAMADVLGKSKFTNGADMGKVAQMYRKFFEEVAPGTRALDFANESGAAGWGTQEAEELAGSLPAFTSCSSLILTGHALGDDGIKVLAAAFAKMPALEELYLRDCDFGEAGLEALATITIPSLPNLRRLQMSTASMENEPNWALGEKHPIEEAWIAAGKLSFVDWW